MGEGPASRAIIWVARIWSLAAVGFVLLFLVGEGLNGQGGKPTGAEWIGWLSGRGAFVSASSSRGSDSGSAGPSRQALSSRFTFGTCLIEARFPEALISFWLPHLVFCSSSRRSYRAEVHKHVQPNFSNLSQHQVSI